MGNCGPLNFAVADAREIGEAMRRLGGGLYGGVEVKTLVDGEVTAANLDRAFAELAPKVSPDDVFVFFLSGHGKTVDGRFYFIPQDYSYGAEELTSKAISRINCRKVHPRPAPQGLAADRRLPERIARGGSAIAQRAGAVHGDEPSDAILGARGDGGDNGRQAGCRRVRQHGVFTYALLSGLSGADAERKGVIDVERLGAFVRQMVPELTWGAWHRIQVPQVRLTGSNFALVRAAPSPLVPAAVDERFSIPSTPTNVVAFATAARSGAQSRRAHLERHRNRRAGHPHQCDGNWSLVARQGHIVDTSKQKI